MGDFVYFTTEKLDIGADGRKKTLFPKWKWEDETKEKHLYPKEHYKKLIKPHHKVNVILTGEINNITVFDFDSQDAYWDTVAEYPLLHNAYTVKTKKGFHIYCQYDKDQKTTTNEDLKIDVRNDNALAFGAGTKTEYNTSYELIDNKQRLDIPMPMEFYYKIAPSSKPRGNKKNKGRKINVVKPKETKVSSLYYKIVENIALKYIKNRSDWKQIIWAMKNEGFTKQECIELSKKAPNYSDGGFENIWAYERSVANMGTLKYYSRESNEDKYIDIHIEEGEYHFLERTDVGLAEVFCELIEGDILYQDEEGNAKLYIYDRNEWKNDSKGYRCKKRFLYIMRSFINKKITKAKEQIEELDKDDEDGRIEQLKLLQFYDEVKKSIATVSKQNNVIDACKTLLINDENIIKFDIDEDQYYNIHFNNGVVDYKTGLFRQRTKKDYITKKLTWDYVEDYDEEAMKYVKNLFTKIEPIEERRVALLSFLSYCLTGNTSLQKMYLMIGETSNGKSTCFKIMKNVFEFYVTKLDRDTFNQNYQKRHKQLLELVESPVRMSFVEEMNEKKVDAEFMKDIVDGGEQNVEVLYNTKKVAYIQSKIMTASNNDPNINTDAAVKRRLIIHFLKSKFVDDIDEDDIENNLYVKDDQIFKKFKDNDKLKNALFHLLLDYKEVKIPQTMVEETNKKADEMNQFIEQFDIYYTITDNEDDVLPVVDMETQLTGFNKKRIIKEINILSDKYEKVKYDKGRMVNKKRGVVTGIILNDEEENFEG